jgi:ABC-type sugar transport system, permease component
MTQTLSKDSSKAARGRTLRQVRKVVISVVVWALVGVWYFPVLWMLSTSLKPTTEAIIESPPRLIPQHPTLDNYKTIFSPASGVNIPRALINSTIVGLLTVAATLIISVPAGYALARLKFRGRKAIFWVYVGILAFPGALFLVPNYYIIYGLGMMDSFAALILPGLASTFGVFLVRQYMVGLPQDLEDAAWIDGCSRTRFLLKILVPMVMPSVFVLGLMTFLGSWNNFLWPLLVLNNPNNLTLPMALARFNVGWADPFRGIGPLMAGAFVSVAPTLLIFIFFHRYLMDGISVGSISKG